MAMRFLGSVRRYVLGISLEEATFVRRGFRATDPSRQARLERIGQTFVQGYLDALNETNAKALASHLREVDVDLRGFAFEGAAMGLTLLDHLSFGPGHRWKAFLDGPGAEHAYMLYVGAGWAIARIPWARVNIESRLNHYDPLLRWLVLDGFGFHQGYFHWAETIQQHRRPPRLSSYAQRAFDQGLGRSLWFVDGADVVRVVETIDRFPSSRRHDLYSGVGLACAYAGGVQRAAIEKLREASGPYRACLAQGASFAAKARVRAGNLGTHTELACQLLCGASAEEAAAATDECRTDARADGDEPAYEHWRKMIQERLTKRVPSNG